MMGGTGSGRKRRPLALKVIEGTARGRDNPEQPKPPKPKSYPCPPELKAGTVGRALWRKYAKQLVDCGLFTEIDLHAFKDWCYLRTRLVEVREVIAKRGRYKRNAAGTVQIAAWARDEAEVLDRLKRLATELGMTPSSRGRVPPAETLPDDEESRILKGLLGAGDLGTGTG